MLNMLATSMRRLRNDSSGVAFVEFAYTLPVVLALAMGGLEVTNLALTHLRVNQVAQTAADNAARVRVQIDEADIDEIFAGVELEGRSIDIARNGRVVISSLQDNEQPGPARGQMIGWQRCFGGRNVPPRYGRQNDGRTGASMRDGMGPPGRRITAQPGTAVMFVEVTYQYEPQLFAGFVDPREIRYETAFNVRERAELGITNVRGRPIKGC